MGFLTAVVLFPLLLWGLAMGCGAAVERLTGARLPVLLLAPIGFGAMIVASQLTMWFGATAPLTPFVLVALALAGILIPLRAHAGRWRERPAGWWWTLVPWVATYLLVAAPVIAAGERTFTGYLLDTTGAVQLSGAEHLLQHGHAIAAGPPVYWTTLSAYFGNGYPSGGHGVLAAVGWLTGQNLIWLYTVFQAAELGIMALALTYLARRAGLGRPAATVVGVIASVPALLYAYALMGSIKEITALPELVLMGALVATARPLRRAVGLRAVLPFAVAAAATLDSIGLAGGAWVGCFAVAALVAAFPVPLGRAELPGLAAGAAALAAGVAVLALPIVGPLSRSLSLAESVSSSNGLAVNDPGNLLRPLKFLQTLGVWVGESHRVDPKYLNQTYVLMGIAGVCIGLGLFWLVRRRAWSVLAFALVFLVVREVLHDRATYWTDAKLLVILTPAVVFVALVGAFSLMQRSRIEGVLLATALSVGVLASDGLLYHATNLAPTQRYEELAAIGEGDRHAPTLTPDFDEYAIYLLRKWDPDGPGFAHAGAFAFQPGVAQSYGHSYDLDGLALATVERFDTIVMRRSPAWSRPPANFSPVQRGRYYTVWQRQGAAPIEHFPLGGSWQPTGDAACTSVQRIAGAAERRHALIAFSPRPANVALDIARASRTALIGPGTDLEGRQQAVFLGPARVRGAVRVARPGRYALWLGGTVDRPLQVLVDGRLAGAPARQSGGDGTAIYVATLTLAAGRHEIELRRGGGSLRPDDTGSTFIDGVILEPLGAEGEGVQRIAPGAWRSLCGRSLDWIEIVR